MPRSKNQSNYSEIDDIKSDLNSLKSNIIELTRQVKTDGEIQKKELTDITARRLANYKKAGQNYLKTVETQVSEKPAQSMAMAFAAGAVISYMLGRR